MPSIRSNLAAWGALALAGLLANPATGGQATAPWPMAGHDASHGGTAGGPAPPYRVAWTADAPSGGPATGPVVADDRVVVVGRTAVAALDTADGSTVWEEPRPEGPAGTPAIAGDLVIHSAGRGESAVLVGRALEDGRRAWSAPMGAAAGAGLTVAGDLLVAGTRDGRLIALDAATGEERWEFETEGAFEGPPAVGEGLVVAAAVRPPTERSRVIAVSEEDGSGGGPPEWEFSPPVPGPITAPAIDGDSVIVGTGEQAVRSLGLAEGEERWSVPSRDVFAARQVPAVPDGVVVADRSHVSRLDPEAGEERWTFQVADLRPLAGRRFNTLSASSPAVVNGVVLIGGGNGEMSAIDLESGRRVWRGDLGEGAVSAPAAGPDLFYAAVLGERGAVVALETDPDGRLLDEVSPTVLFPGRAVLNFAVAAVLVGAALLLLSRGLARVRATGEAAP